MNILTDYLELSTKGGCDVIDITKKNGGRVKSSKKKTGIMTLSVIGSTAALTTCEYEPGLIKDLKEIFEKLIPEGKEYRHDQAWGDGNGHAHLRSSLVGPSLTLPFGEGKLILGTWQQVIFIDFDNRPRQRKIVLQILGE